MLITRQNRLLPVLVGIVLLMLVLVAMRSCGRQEGSAVLDAVPVATRPDADSPADTIETLTANVAAMTEELERLRASNKALRDDNQDLFEESRAVRNEVQTQIERALSARDRDDAALDTEAVDRLRQRVDALSAALSTGSRAADPNAMPVGLGLPTEAPSSQLVWIEPLDQSAPGVTDSLTERLGGGSSTRSARATSTTDPGEPVPVYTVPRNATLMGATAMTALVGRVPVRGEVRDPMPFKIITGADNLAANGFTIPGLNGMIWSGTAIGDWTLSCITGRLESVTFIFDDGSIRSISSDDREGRDGDRSLGWISDARGIPCIGGERKSNAAAFLSQRIGVSLVEAAAQAAAAAETTTVIRDSGAISSTVAGDRGDYVLGKALADSSGEIAAWLAERQAQNFDAVFAPAGQQLAIHVDRELTLDHDIYGRRLVHDTNPHPAAHRPLD